jgi:uncharacterized protein
VNIKLNELANNQLVHLEINEPWDKFAALQDIMSQGVRFDGPVVGSLRLERAGEIVDVRGHLKLAGFVACSRCLTEKALALEAAVDLTLCLHAAEEDLTEERELTEEELGLVPVVGEEIDLNPLVAEQLILALPIKVLCSESCKGLCPQCGQNLNEGDCHCGDAAIPGPFDALKKLKLDR